MATNSKDMKDFFAKGDGPELPKDFQWENMEAGIRDKMERIQASEAKDRPSFFWRKPYLLPLVLLLVLGSGLGYLFFSPRGTDGPETELRAPLPVSGVKSESEEIISQAKLKNRTRSLQDSKNSKLIEGGQTELSSKHSDASSRQHSLKKFQTKHSLEPANSVTQSSESEQSSASITDKEDELAGRRTNVLKLELKESRDLVKGLKLEDEPKLDLLPILDTGRLRFYKGTGPADQTAYNNLPADTSENAGAAEDSISAGYATTAITQDKLDKLKKSRGQLMLLEAGLSLWDAGTGESLPGRDQYESNLLSHQVQGHYQWYIKPGTFLMLGFQYQQLESKLDYRKRISDYQIVLRDTVIRVTRNMATGREEPVYGDVSQSVEAERLVIHYNRSRFLRISFGAGKSWQLKGFQADLYGGFALNTLSHHQGRTLINNDIVNYSNGANAVIRNSLLPEAFAGGRLHYFIQEGLALTGGLQIQQSLMNGSQVENGQYRPFSAGLNFGISYRMK